MNESKTIKLLQRVLDDCLNQKYSLILNKINLIQNTVSRSFEIGYKYGYENGYNDAKLEI